MQYIPPNQQQGVSGEEFQEIFSVFLSLSALCVCKLSIAICWQTELSQKSVAYHYKIFVCLFVLIFKLYNIVLVLPYFSMNPPQVYTRSPSWAQQQTSQWGATRAHPTKDHLSRANEGITAAQPTRDHPSPSMRDHHNPANERPPQPSQWKTVTLLAPSFLQWTLCL